jgi:hypothetical protein
MNSPDEPGSKGIPNGGGAAAILAAGIGSFALAVIAIAGDRVADFRKLMNFYTPTGPLSGVTTTTIVVWLAAWAALELRWHRRTVNLGRIAAAALALLIASLLLTFPPLADLL